MRIQNDLVSVYAETGRSCTSYFANNAIKEEIAFTRCKVIKANSVVARHKMVRRLRVLTHMMHSNVRPEWIIMDVLPVLPPDLRPLVPFRGWPFCKFRFKMNCIVVF